MTLSTSIQHRHNSLFFVRVMQIRMKKPLDMRNLPAIKEMLLFLSLCFYGITAPVPVVHAQAGSEKTGKVTPGGIWLPRHAEELPGLRMGPFVRLNDSRILTVDGTGYYVSKDEGKTWESGVIFRDSTKFRISNERVVLQTKNGVIMVAFMNMKERANWNWQKEISDSPGAILPTYVVRSLDGGKTWLEPQKLHNEWTGAIRTMIETRHGNIIFTSMMMRNNPGHHTVLTYTSFNDGKDWTKSNVIDLGGIGHHSGVTESTIAQLSSGRIWQLMRTNWGTFWEAFSDDEGITWKDVRPTSNSASSAPGLLKRLESGRLMLLWNRRFPEGKDYYPLRGGDSQWSEVAASNHREELSMAFSDDDGKTWSPPVVIAKSHKVQNEDTSKTWLSYPYAFEAAPGQLWITTMQGGLRMKLHEADFTGK